MSAIKTLVENSTAYYESRVEKDIENSKKQLSELPSIIPSETARLTLSTAQSLIEAPSFIKIL